MDAVLQPLVETQPSDVPAAARVERRAAHGRAGDVVNWQPRLTVFVPGIPKPGGSKTAQLIRRKGGEIVTKNGRPLITMRDDAKGNADWKRNVAYFARREYGDALLITGPMRVTIKFVMPRLAGHFGSGRNAGVLKPNAPHFHTVKPDATKLMRSTEDAMTGVVWLDDARIVEQRVSKVYGDKPGAEIVVEELVADAVPAREVTAEPLFAGAGGGV